MRNDCGKKTFAERVPGLTVHYGAARCWAGRAVTGPRAGIGRPGRCPRSARASFQSSAPTHLATTRDATAHSPECRWSTGLIGPVHLGRPVSTDRCASNTLPGRRPAEAWSASAFETAAPVRRVLAKRLDALGD